MEKDLLDLMKDFNEGKIACIWYEQNKALFPLENHSGDVDLVWCMVGHM